ncbi:MAG: type II toxin-antitoxin system VapC family toxin [Magnetococcales bacterium]|nr:type II toxin-antitoxin system VapC family toxin [Magnetococcales bacterium]
MKPKVYLETSIISYLAARPNRDLVVAAHQQITAEWWDKSRRRFDLYTSELVIREAGAGDPKAAARRLEFLAGLHGLTIDEGALSLAKVLVESGAVPLQAAEDALHIAMATMNGMDFLLTWNCKHIANAAMWPRIDAVCRAQGYDPAAIATPEQLAEE